MEEIIHNLYVGDDSAYRRIKDHSGWSVVRCCKEGPGGHREAVGYKTPGAPKGPDYLTKKVNAHHLALNFIDSHDPNHVPLRMIQEGIDFIRAALAMGDKVLVACNQGQSRGPALTMLFLRNAGELEGNFHISEQMFRTLYPPYDPGIGVRQFVRTHWAHFKGDR